jgi:hypothetical protein
MLFFRPFLNGLRLPFEHEPYETNLPATTILPISNEDIRLSHRVHPFLRPQIYPRTITHYLNHSINLFLNIAS